MIIKKFKLFEDVYYHQNRYDIREFLPTDYDSMEELVKHVLSGYNVEELSTDNWHNVKNWIMDVYDQGDMETNFDLYDRIKLVIRGEQWIPNVEDLPLGWKINNPIIAMNAYRKECGWEN